MCTHVTDRLTDGHYIPILIPQLSYKECQYLHAVHNRCFIRTALLLNQGTGLNIKGETTQIPHKLTLQLMQLLQLSNAVDSIDIVSLTKTLHRILENLPLGLPAHVTATHTTTLKSPYTVGVIRLQISLSTPCRPTYISTTASTEWRSVKM